MGKLGPGYYGLWSGQMVRLHSLASYAPAVANRSRVSFFTPLTPCARDARLSTAGGLLEPARMKSRAGYLLFPSRKNQQRDEPREAI